MNDKFDELAKSMAQSVTRRGALKKFGVGFAGVLLATLGLANRTEAKGKHLCNCHKPPYWGCKTQDCLNECALVCT